MKKLFLLVTLALSACAGKDLHHARYAEEKNAPKFGNTRTYVEAPADVRIAARAALDGLTAESEPPVTGSVKEDEESVRSGWVYGVSKQRYVEYKVDNKPQRKPLRVRRKYTYNITPGLAGSDVTFGVEEETMQVDLRTGEEKGWKSETTDPAVYDLLARRLTEELRKR